MIKKILLGLLILVVLVVGGFAIFVMTKWDKTYDIPYPDLKTTTDSAVIAHGDYLVHGPAHCVECHVGSVEAMISADKGNPEPLQGGVAFVLGPLGTIYPKNLTPDKETGIGRYEDKEIFRMMRHGVKPNGRASLPLMMPFWNMADDDLVAIVSYFRSTQPVRHFVPEPQWTTLGKVIRSISPTFEPIYNPTPPAKAPAMAPTVERGEYLARYVANCVGCHTERDPKTFEAIDKEFAGGMEFEPFPELHKALNVPMDLWARSPNITPYANSAFSKFKTKEEWINRFRNERRKIPSSPMPWGQFATMTDEDLEALYVYLHSLAPVEKDIEETTFIRKAE